MSEAKSCLWIKKIEELKEIERAQMEDQFPILAINETFAFDLVEWIEAKGWEANTLPPLKKNEAKILQESITRYGVLEKTTVDINDGWIADGNHRLQDYFKARSDGIEIPFAGFVVREFSSAEEREAFQATRSFVGRVPNTKMKRQAAKRAIKHHLDWADNRIACEIGIDQQTVTSVSEEMVTNGEIEPRPEMREGADGRLHKAPKTKKKETKTTNSHPLLPLITAWHTARGGHGTTPLELVPIAQAAGIDLVELGACKSNHDEGEKLRSFTAWLGKNMSGAIGGFWITAYRYNSSRFILFTLVRGKDYRPDLDQKQSEEVEESSIDNDDTTSENRNS